MDGGRKLSHEPTTLLRKAYNKLVRTGHIDPDSVQIELIHHLDRLLNDLESKRLSSKSSSLGWLFAKKQKPVSTSLGLYIWGGVGRGKSMLMDLFFEHLPHKRKRRVHFNDFMQDAQDRIHAHRNAFKEGRTKIEDPVAKVAEDLAAEARVLCFDEFTVTDIADAMILGRLFEAMFSDGVTIVATSNVVPDNLYKNGLNRTIFLPFIALLKDRMDVFELDARTDFRLEKLNQAPVYYTPLNAKNTGQMNEAWLRITGVETGAPDEITLKGRILPVPQAANGAARFSFAELCETPRSAADYLALARQFHTVFIDRIPKMDRSNQNAAKRFILMIDTFYDNHVKLIVSAAAKPDELYSAKSGTEAFEFARTASRLHEMQSVEYLGTN